MKFYINGFTVEAETEEEAQIVANELEKEEDRQVYEMIEERLKNDDGTRYTFEEVMRINGITDEDLTEVNEKNKNDNVIL